MFLIQSLFSHMYDMGEISPPYEQATWTQMKYLIYEFHKKKID